MNQRVWGRHTMKFGGFRNLRLYLPAMNQRRLIKTALDRVGSIPFVQSLVTNRLRETRNILYYHFAGDPAPHYQSFDAGCTVAAFERQLRLLQRYFDFCSLDDALSPETPTGARPQLAITFDDGLDLISSGAMDVLDRYGVSATVFVCTRAVDNRALLWTHMLSAIRYLAGPEASERSFNRIAESEAVPTIDDAAQIVARSKAWPMARKDDIAQAVWDDCGLPPVSEYLEEHQPYLTHDQLQTWREHGHSVGLHTASHPLCERLDADGVEAEIAAPAKQLQEWGYCDGVPFA